MDMKATGFVRVRGRRHRGNDLPIGITDSAAFTCRVSRSSTGSPLSRNAPYA
jgi:hypothetical protein